MAEIILTADGPEIMKSVPLPAMELHRIGSPNVSVIDDGVQGGGVTVPIAIAGWALSVNDELLPAGTCLH